MTTITRNSLINQISIQFVRPQILTLTLIDSRPNTKLYVFFSEENITHLCNHPGNAIGTDIVSDDFGQAVIHLNVPPNRFNTGIHEITISDTVNLSDLDISGSVYGSATATFSSTGRLDIYQTTKITIKRISRPPARPTRPPIPPSPPIPSNPSPIRWGQTRRIFARFNRDPLAQSFFTFGETEGIFLSSIDVFFQTKDAVVPVRCEIRPLVNGYPSSEDPSHINLVSVLKPDFVYTSTDASLPSKFIFDPPIFLKGDSEFCFVLRSNSNNYNIFTSRMGEISNEDGRKIHEQPYVGSLFKSENAITWTAEQFDDIKFNLNKAQFETGSGINLVFDTKIPPIAVEGDSFILEAGSNEITYAHFQEHGLEVGSKFKVVTRTDDLFANAEFNGIPYTEFNAEHTVTGTPDRKTLKFLVTTNASSSGAIETASIVTQLDVTSQGSGYIDSDAVVFTGGGGSGAAAELVVSDGKVIAVTLTNAGTGYTSPPSVSITSTFGSGASIVSSLKPGFTVFTNKPMTGFVPFISLFDHGNTETSCSLATTLGNYEGGNLNTYNPGKTIVFDHKHPIFNIEQSSLIASLTNETNMMAGSPSARLTVTMNTNNPNVSPVLDYSQKPKLIVYSNKINRQLNETLTASDSSGSVNNIIVSNGGSGYTSIPTVTISEPDLENGVQAEASATVAGEAVTAINVDVAGSGYLSVPEIMITGGGGSGAAAQAQLTNFNSELLATGGNAKSKYITKKISLQIPSTGIRLNSVLSSTNQSSVDWYIRTSLSTTGDSHDEQEWHYLTCNEARNKSEEPGQMYEYEFKVDNLSEFDTYDLKCVLIASDPTKSPIVESYRAIIVV